MADMSVGLKVRATGAEIRRKKCEGTGAAFCVGVAAVVGHGRTGGLAPNRNQHLKPRNICLEDWE
jgi:hypothetical protein